MGNKWLTALGTHLTIDYAIIIQIDKIYGSVVPLIPQDNVKTI